MKELLCFDLLILNSFFKSFFCYIKSVTIEIQTVSAMSYCILSKKYI